MKFIHRKPGFILLPVSAVLIIFIVLLGMLIGQKQTNNSLILEYKAGRVINLLLDLYVTDQQINPADIDENILGYGIYDEDRNAIVRFGSAPENLSIIHSSRGRNTGINRRSIIIVRSGDPQMMRQVSPNMMRRLSPQSPVFKKYRTEIFLEYSNSSYLTERRLIFLIVGLFLIFFTIAAVLIYRLYQSNRMLLVKTEHDKQLIQLGEAARTLAHEIRNPLGALKLQRDLLSRKLPPGYEGNLEIIDRELKRLNTLVDRVGEFLRNPVGHPEKINLADFALNLYSGRNEIIINESGGTAGIDTIFDRERLRTVLDNLINNALESGSSAEVIITTSGAQPVLIVRDSGGGFSDEALERLYDPFFTTKNNGTGLGLSVVKRLVESAGGRIAASNWKNGAEVKIIFGDRFENTDS